MPERYLGQTLGKYRIDALIGTGGFAWVYKAYDPELEIPVALKVLKPQYAGDEQFEQRFRREASTAAKLRHPNIIKIFAVGREGDAVFFAMDYLPQGLADRLAVMTALPESMLIRMAIDVASALGFAHREGVIHRDIKTDNILFDEHGNAIVADFGIARAVSGYAEQTGTNMVVGTPQYFSPEQARGLTLDGRADLYSLGVTLFKAATGQLPFTGSDWYEIARQHVEDRPPRPRSINPGLSRELEDVILRCLEKDPEHRFPSGEAFCEDLMHLLAERGETAVMRTSAVPSQTISSPRPAYVSARVRRLRSPRTWVAAGAAAAVLAAALAVRFGRDDAAAKTPASAVGPPLGGSDSARGVSAPSPPPPVLAISAPTAANVSINDVTLGTNAFEADTLAPGDYVVRASVSSLPGCPSAAVVDTIRLLDTGRTSIELSPRPCGTLMVLARHDAQNADLELVPVGPGASVQRRLPLRDPLVLPAGRYRVRAQKRLCTAYIGDVEVRPDRQSEHIIPGLICG